MGKEEELYGVAQVGGCVADHVAQVGGWEGGVEAECKEDDREVLVQSKNDYYLLEDASLQSRWTISTMNSRVLLQTVSRYLLICSLVFSISLWIISRMRLSSS